MEPRAAWENGRAESCNGKLRDELLNGEISYTRRGARIVIDGWRREYHQIRPQRAPGHRPPPSRSQAACRGRLRCAPPALKGPRCLAPWMLDHLESRPRANMRTGTTIGGRSARVRAATGVLRSSDHAT
ncbi:MAG: integrase core domain-containing protein [Planctomycetota bacterium]